MGKWEFGIRKWECGNAEVGMWNSEVGMRKWERVNESAESRLRGDRA